MEIKVRITPQSRKEQILRKDEKTFLISVREKAEDNKANIRMKEILAEFFHTRTQNVRIFSGHHARSKVIRIT